MTGLLERIRGWRQLRLVIAIPVLTTLLVLGLGLVIVDLNNRELLGNQDLQDKTVLKRQIETTMDHMVIVIVGGSVLAFVTGLALTLTILIPIRRLAKDTASIARGDLTRAIRLEGSGEIAMLGSAFNEMITSINRYMLQSMSSGVLTISEAGNITSISADAEVILGVTADRVMGRPITRIFPRVPENTAFLRVLDETLAERITVSNRELLVSTEARDNIPVSVSTSLLRDRDNTLVGLIISFEDVAQLRNVQEQLRKVDRLTTLGGLAAGIAHQVRNPLCSIRGLAQLLREGADDATPLKDYSDIILKDVDRIDLVVDRLLRFLQPTATGWTLEDVNEIIRDTLALGKHEIRSKPIEVVEDLAADLPKVLVQSENLLQAMLNIIINAFQAIEEAGTVTVRSRTVATRGGDPGMVRVEISDDGPGITKENMKHIFEPSFTTKDDGAGFGLVISQQTLEAHGGSIEVTSEPGKGTCFILTLPVREYTTDMEDQVGSSPTAPDTRR
jgi:PAS domain S-box-containing protein